MGVPGIYRHLLHCFWMLGGTWLFEKCFLRDAAKPRYIELAFVVILILEILLRLQFIGRF